MSGEPRWPKDAAEYEIPRDGDGKPIWYFNDRHGPTYEELWILGSEDEAEIYSMFGRYSVTPEERAETEALATLYSKAPLLYETLLDMRGYVACDCGHPACSRCRDTMEIDAALAAARGETL